jgi:hypothetical protein
MTWLQPHSRQSPAIIDHRKIATRPRAALLALIAASGELVTCCAIAMTVSRSA